MASSRANERDTLSTGGSFQSIYATATPAASASPQINTAKPKQQHLHSSPQPQQDIESPSVNQGEWIGTCNQKKPTRSRISVRVSTRNKDTSVHDTEDDLLSSKQSDASQSSLSLSERLGMASNKSVSLDYSQTAHPSSLQKSKGDGSSPDQPLHTNPSTNATQIPFAKTPLSATLPLPETPLKHEGRNAKRDHLIPSSSRSELKSHNTNLKIGSVPKGGLMLDAGGGDPVLPQELQTPGKERFMTGLTENMQEVPLPQKLSVPLDQMVAKLRVSQSPARGTQESRWAVKPSEEPSEGYLKSSEAIQSDDVFTSTSPNEVPLSDRSNATPSLLDRISPSVNQASQPKREVRAKKERKRGSRKHEGQSLLNATTNTVPQPRDALATPSSDAEEFVDPVASGSQSSQQSTRDTGSKDGKNPLSSSTSTASVAASTSPASSHTAGNDTLTSINWADDDDELPDLPEEWTRAAHGLEPEQGDDTNGDALASSELSPTVEEHANGFPRRGAKRGGRGRIKKGPTEVNMHAASDGSGGGLRIAGSAGRNQDKGSNTSSPPARKELFPNHKLEGDMSSKAKKINQSGHTHAEAKPHGRPRLAAGSKDAFDRLTRGAVSTKSTTKMEGSRIADRPLRSQREGGASISSRLT